MESSAAGGTALFPGSDRNCVTGANACGVEVVDVLWMASDKASCCAPTIAPESNVSEESYVPLILVIEDDAAIRTVYTELLGDEGYRVVTWGSVQADDLAAVTALAPDLIILDLLMGGQALGWMFLNALYADPPTQDIPVLVVSAAGALAKEHMAAIETWGCGYLAKPFDLDELLAAVEKCLESDCSEISIPA
jgi:CheY-like chemotaxis protein